MGLQGNFCTFLSGVYSNPMAQICTPGIISQTFPLCKGTRHGCPLSPLLFNIALEPLDRFLKTSDTYKRIAVGKEEVKIALFMDHVILFMSNPGDDLYKVFQIISSFGSFLGYKINATKSEALQIGIPREVKTP